MLRGKTITFLAIVALSILLSGCFIILIVVQPGAAIVGEAIVVEIEVQLTDEDANPKCGLVGIMLPISWVVDSVYFTGDVGPDYCIFLPPDVEDCDVGGQIDFGWADSLEVRWPSGPDMEWRVYQSTQSWNKPDPLVEWFVDLFIKMTVGNQNGNFNLRYFVTNAGLDFSDPAVGSSTGLYYDISEGIPITVTGATAVEDEGIIATEYNLMQNFPNPFNPSTTITFSIPESGNVKLTVFNSLGEEVATLVDEYVSAGVKTVTFEAVNNFSGVYYYRMETSTFVVTKKMILLK